MLPEQAADAGVLQDLATLETLRNQIRNGIAKASVALDWFALQFEDRQRLPANLWRRLDRPLPKETKTLGCAFDVWHAILRAERSLRYSARGEHQQQAKALRDRAKHLEEKLTERLGTLTDNAASDISGANHYARALTADDVFGTFNVLSAASVLRSEVFPQRSHATPSYVAGHVLIAELLVARSQARSDGLSGIRDRAPRLAPVAQGVHSLMLYVEHLRKRADLFQLIAGEIEDIQTEAARMGDDRHTAKVLDGRLRIGMARIAEACNECQVLVLATRPFFKDWQGLLEEAVRAKDILGSATLARTCSRATKLFPSVPAPGHALQQRAEQVADRFCKRLGAEVRAVHTALGKVLFGVHHKYADLRIDLLELERALNTLKSTHLDSSDAGRYPSIRDAARFQFGMALLKLFSSDRHLLDADQISDPSIVTAVRRRLHALISRFGLKYSLSDERDATAMIDSDCCRTLEALGQAEVGKNVLRWWSNYAACYDSGSPQSRVGDQNHDRDAGRWIDWRARSFRAIADLSGAIARAVGESDDEVLLALTRALKVASVKERDLSAEIGAFVKQLVEWCAPYGQQLLLACSEGTLHLGDANELASALWIADRIGEPWDVALEEEARKAIGALQRSDGSFSAAAPLYQNRGFLFYLPSASTIATIARFVGRGPNERISPKLRDRLRRWEPILRLGASFLLESMVGRAGTLSALKEAGHYAGWHSDRHPQPERIDLFATTEALTALCRTDDALKVLINLKATTEFSVEWPAGEWQRALPADAESRDQQILLRVAELIRGHRLAGALYRPQLEPDLDASAPAKCAFTLYGPPGTGKTFFQRIIASQLQWPLVTLAVGDFLRDGDMHVGKRAADVFARLRYLSDTCIVFDEFDVMVPRRSHRSNGAPGHPALGMLTAAMLPLLGELRSEASRRHNLVCFTTNYLENIDPAALRKGRVDERFPLVYQDYSSRVLFAINKGCCFTEDVRELALHTALCTRPDVSNAVEVLLKTQRLAPAPPLAVESSYYLDDSRTEVAEIAALLIKSVGGDAQQDEWLSRHKDWRRVHQSIRRQPVQQSAPRTSARRSSRRPGADKRRPRSGR